LGSTFAKRLCLDKIENASLSTQPGTVQYLKDTPKRREVGYIMLYKFIYIIYIPLNSH
jgi:hypothetical protein